MPKSVFLEGGGSLERKFQTEVASLTNHCWFDVRKLEWLPFVWYQNVRNALFGFAIKHACDKRTDGQTDERTDRIMTANAR